jgi:hypothetical protein
MAREKELWAWLSKARLELKHALHMHRVENSASPGMPDVEGCMAHGRQFWFELKSAERPVRAKTPVRFKMRPKQVEWARRRWQLEGRVYWLLQIGSGKARRIYMLAGPEGAALTRGLTEAEIAARCFMRGGFDTPEPGSVIHRAAWGTMAL